MVGVLLAQQARPGPAVAAVDTAADGGDQFPDIAKDASAKPMPGEIAEEALGTFSHEQPVGVKCTWKRGCRASHRWTFGCLRVA
jgi:hypothetical protein